MRLSDLLSEPFVFTQTELLTPDQFCTSLEMRHVRLGGIRPRTGHLEALHRRQILVPWFRVTSAGALTPASAGWATGSDDRWPTRIDAPGGRCPVCIDSHFHSPVEGRKRHRCQSCC